MEDLSGGADEVKEVRGGEEEMSNLNRLNRKVSSVITCKEIWSHTYARTQLSQV